MAHARQQIRDAFINQITSLLTTGNNVYNHRPYSISATNLPALRVRTNEEIDQTTALGDVSVRNVEIVVDVLVRSATGAVDSIDSICVEVEEAIAADETLGGVAEWCRPTNFELEISDDTEAPAMQGMLTFSAQYRVDRTDVETIVS